MIRSFPEDKVGQRLSELGIEVLDYKATDSPYDREVLAKRFIKDDAEVIYSFAENDTSTLVLGYYRLLKRKAGLSNAFAEIIWFLDFLKNENVGVKRVTCTVKIPDTDYTKPLSSAKMVRFCTDLVGGHIVAGPNLIPWYVLDLKDYTGLKLKN
jgi:hypothetical protein